LLNDLNSGRSSAIHQVGDLLKFDDYTQGITPMVINGLNGNVGIGIAAPGARLSVEIGSTTIPSAKFNNLAGDAGSTVHIVESETSSDHFGLFVGDNDTNGAKLTAVLLTKYRNVGIGAINPAGKLHVSDLSESIGNVDVIQGSNQITGTDLNTKLSNGDKIRINTSTFTVSSVTATTLTLSSNWPNATINGVEAFKNKELFIVKNNGNVGIGTTSPTNALNVIRSSTSGVPVAWLHNSNNTVAGNFGTVVSCINNGASINVFQVRSNNSTHTNGNGLFTVKGDGNVGIGTTDPGQGKLVTTGYGGNTETRSFVAIRHNNNVESYFRIARMGSADSTSVSLANNYNRDVPGYQADDNTEGVSDITFRDDGSLSFSTGAAGTSEPTEKMRIDAAGNVGIGVASSSAKLHIQGDDNEIYDATDRLQKNGATFFAYNISNTNGSFSQLALGNRNQNGSMSRISSVLVQEGTSKLSFSTTKSSVQSESFVISSGGIDIKSRSAQRFCQANWFSGALSYNGYITIDSGPNGDKTIQKFVIGVADLWVNDGFEGISIRCKSSVLDSFIFKPNGNLYGLNWVPGSTITINGSGEIVATSDKRLKNDLGDCEYGLNEVLQLKPKKYTWKDGPKDQKATIGFFAQDLYGVMEEAGPRTAKLDDKGNPVTDEDGKPDYDWGMNSNAIIAALVKAIQEQQQLIEDLKSRIETLENK